MPCTWRGISPPGTRWVSLPLNQPLQNDKASPEASGHCSPHPIPWGIVRAAWLPARLILAPQASHKHIPRITSSSLASKQPLDPQPPSQPCARAAACHHLSPRPAQGDVSCSLYLSSPPPPHRAAYLQAEGSGPSPAICSSGDKRQQKARHANKQCTSSRLGGRRLNPRRYGLQKHCPQAPSSPAPAQGSSGEQPHTSPSPSFPIGSGSL